MSNTYKQILDRIVQMPVLSSAPYQLITALADRDFDVDEIVRIMETDISLTARCLQVVNSAAYGLPRQISSIRQAIVLLGSHTLVQIVLIEGFRDILTRPLDGYEAERNALWDHSIRTAIASKSLAETFAPELESQLAYTAGLLHDIGKAIISDFLEEVSPGEKLAEKPDRSYDFLEFENDSFDIDHAKAGGMMAKNWNFPESLQAAIRYHHAPSEAPEKFQKLVESIHLGDILAMLGGSGTGIDSLAYNIDPITDKLFTIDKQKLAFLICEIDMEYLEIMKKFEVIAGSSNES